MTSAGIGDPLRERVTPHDLDMVRSRWFLPWFFWTRRRGFPVDARAVALLAACVPLAPLWAVSPRAGRAVLRAVISPLR